MKRLSWILEPFLLALAAGLVTAAGLRLVGLG